MAADPEPQNAISNGYTQRAAMETNADRLKKRPAFLKCNDGWRGSAFSKAKFLSARIRTGSGSLLWHAQKSGEAKCFKVQSSGQTGMI